MAMTSPGRGWPVWAPWLAGPLAFAALTALAGVAEANATTVGLLYLLLVLGFATWGGWGVGIAASITATFCLNFFFLEPVHTFTIADPANWVSLGAFLLSSALVSRLVTRARQEAAEALDRKREVETLYDLCFGLFAATDTTDSLGLATARTLQAIGAEAGGLATAGRQGEVLWLHRIGEASPALDALAARALATGALVPGEEVAQDAGAAGTSLALPLSFSGSFGGPAPTLLVAQGNLASRAVLEPSARLLALACERARLMAEAARLEATRQSEQLKTALLRAVSHDLRTPLTGMRLFADSLQRQLAGRPEELESLHGLVLEQERLRRRIDNLLAFARLEAGVAQPHREPLPAAALIQSARDSLGPILAARPLRVTIAPGCPELDADPALSLEILVNLVENAARSAPAGEEIEIRSSPDPAGGVRLEILDRGPGIPAGVRWRTGDAARGTGGLGLEIARAFTEAQGGHLTFHDRPGGGTIARIELPAAAEPPAATADEALAEAMT